MKSVSIFVVLFVLTVFVSCDKDDSEQSVQPIQPVQPVQPERFCWQIVDYNGNKVDVICDKTETELINCIADGSCPVYSGITYFTSCNYYKIKGDKFCWLINGNYIDSSTENEARWFSNCFQGGAEPILTDCQNCQWWFHREKRTFKPTNTFTYSSVTYEHFCGDTTNTLFQGRQIIRKDDVDSLIVIQFSADGSTW